MSSSALSTLQSFGFGKGISFAILLIFVGTVLLLEISECTQTLPDSQASIFENHTRPVMPDFRQFLRLRTIPEVELNNKRRIIIIGDIHGSEKPLENLLTKVSYNAEHDLLIHLGDIVTKGPSSISILNTFAKANVTGVRGNHDQEVIEWRAYIEWIESFKGGSKWLRQMERMSRKHLEAESMNPSSHWSIPKGWNIRSEHYLIARHMTHAQYSYLLGLPLTIHIPSIHIFLVHAGLLPLDLNHSTHSRHQPLSHLPKHSKSSTAKKDVQGLREAQELAVLNDIPQNNDPFTLLHMRSILHGEVTRGVKKGKPWANLWNDVLSRCGGFDVQGAEDDNRMGQGQLPCRPITVVYGHAASRGLDINRWSAGLDTGCVYGRRLTSLVIDLVDNSERDIEAEAIRFGDDGKAKLVSVAC